MGQFSEFCRCLSLPGTKLHASFSFVSVLHVGSSLGLTRKSQQIAPLGLWIAPLHVLQTQHRFNSIAHANQS